MNCIKVFIPSLALSSVFVSAAVSACAQAPVTDPTSLQQRFERLESQIEAMRAELIKLKAEVLRKNSTAVSETAKHSSDGASVAAALDTSAAAPSQTAKQETKPAPKVTGIDLGPVRATPYGTVYFNAFGNSGGTNNADDPLFATPTNQGNVSMSVRQTRLGLKLEGPTIAHAKSRGQIEADFFGGFPAIGVGENFGIVRLRLAFARLDWEKTSLEAGQDWTIFAPNNPVSIAAAAIPQMGAAGNPWARLPQIRLEHRWASGKVLWQGAVLSPSTGDSPTASTSSFFLQPTTGGAS